MKLVSTCAFNAYGVIAKEEGQEVHISDETVLTNLLNIGFIKEVEAKMETEVQPKARRTKKQ